MKVEARDCKTMSLPQMSLTLKPNSVSIEFASHEPTFIVCVQSKIVSSITLRYSPENFDPSLYHSDILEWQTLFKSAINPSVTYAVGLLEDDTELPAILHVTERNVQLSVAEHAVSSQQLRTRRVGRGQGSNNVISTDIEGVKVTVEDSLLLTLNRTSVTLRTNRLIELYQHLMSYVTGRRNAVGDFAIANFDYVNTRRESRDKLIAEEEADDLYLPYEDTYGYVVHSPRQTPNTSPLLQRTFQTQRPPLPSPISSPKPSRHHLQLAEAGRTHLPKLALHLLSKPAPSATKPEPPPKPKNAKEILSEFEDRRSPSPKLEEPLYKSIRKPKSTISASSIGIGVLSDTSVDNDEPPALPSSRPQYIDFETANHNPLHNYNAAVEYENINPRKMSENSMLSDAARLRTPTRQNAMRALVPANTQQEEEDDEMYESLYSMGSLYSELPHSAAPGPPNGTPGLPNGTPTGLHNYAPPQRPSLLGSPPPPPLPYQGGHDMYAQEPIRAEYSIISKIQLFDKRKLRPVNTKR